MSEYIQEHHVLLIEEQGQLRSIRLDLAVYSAGRHISNTIVLQDRTVSRAHALLIRCPVPGTSRYCYTILDGHYSGQPSTNGTYINEQQQARHVLQPGDVVRFGDTVKASYFRVHMSLAELTELFPLDESLQPTESPELLNSLQTIIVGEDNMPLLATVEAQLDGEITAVSQRKLTRT